MKDENSFKYYNIRCTQLCSTTEQRALFSISLDVVCLLSLFEGTELPAGISSNACAF